MVTHPLPSARPKYSLPDLMRKPPAPTGPEPSAVVMFWREAGPQRWFRKDVNFDRALAARFHAAHLLAAERQLDHWNAHAEGALALQILLDTPTWVGGLLVSITVLVVIVGGGMRSVTLVQGFQYWLKVVAIMVPVLAG